MSWNTPGNRRDGRQRIPKNEGLEKSRLVAYWNSMLERNASKLSQAESVGDQQKIALFSSLQDQYTRSLERETEKLDALLKAKKGAR